MRFSKDMDTIDVTLPLTVQNLLVIFMTVAGVLVIISISTPWFLLAVGPIGCAYVYLMVNFTL